MKSIHICTENIKLPKMVVHKNSIRILLLCNYFKRFTTFGLFSFTEAVRAMPAGLMVLRRWMKVYTPLTLLVTDFNIIVYTNHKNSLLSNTYIIVSCYGNILSLCIEIMVLFYENILEREHHYQEESSHICYLL